MTNRISPAMSLDYNSSEEKQVTFASLMHFLTHKSIERKCVELQTFDILP